MKRLILITISLLVLMTGCGSEVTITVPLPIPIVVTPTITDSQYSIDSVNRYVNGSVDFYASGYDLDAITISIVNSRGVVVEQTVTTLADMWGRTAGTISFAIDYINYRPGQYTFSVYLIDTAGYISNSVYGTFWV